ncbi:BPTI/Kunitz domain-containing protein [Magnetofaba australis]|uniref:BPTI/Kunitz domain-containing protein n=1 Tax=Magnetofaba australis TaxID=1472297 RepID=UPI000A19C9D6|nr:BPTI/Kunitz domain-containing protein [Magnetofaba australis]
MNARALRLAILTLLLTGWSHVAQARPLPSRCYIQPDPGQCQAYIPRYFYDEGSGQCEEFSWGGCGGRVPFTSLSSCRSQCEVEPTARERWEQNQETPD